MEKNQEKETSMKNSVLHKIDAQKVSMRPKRYFVLKAAGAIVLATIVLLISAFIFSFIFFHIRVNDHGYLLSFGGRGFLLFAKLFPWVWLAVDLVLVFVLEWMLRTFRFAYRLPALYLLVGIFLVAAVIGFGVDRATPLDTFYGEFHQQQPPERGTCNCILIRVSGTTLIAHPVEDPGRSLTVVVPPNDPSLEILKPGDTFFAGGDFRNGMLYSFGIHKIQDAGI